MVSEICCSPLQDLESLSHALESSFWRNDRFPKRPLTSSKNAASECPYTAGKNLDKEFHPTKSNHLPHRIVRETQVSTWLSASSMLPFSFSSKARFLQGKTDKEEGIRAKALRYTEKSGHKMATRCEICSQGLLCRENARQVLSIHSHWRSQ